MKEEIYSFVWAFFDWIYPTVFVRLSFFDCIYPTVFDSFIYFHLDSIQPTGFTHLFSSLLCRSRVLVANLLGHHRHFALVVRRHGVRRKNDASATQRRGAFRCVACTTGPMEDLAWKGVSICSCWKIRKFGSFGAFLQVTVAHQKTTTLVFSCRLYRKTKPST